ncbi:MAG: single-stranded-DNA-specific exonuclease RecJ [Geminicoccaceae bacterium]|nr:single-stranded-DNA-specific exonuclease RecJ [Geminicoccaceae bacterium]MDW8124573.1 single-stranded-DNA-specific exonuclease RecJ [Geminicoccaceae bacterium]MDW8341073.1 single-stranded-DNA-specific exonuclease RecJ [Geminicoccaceae bacterium]
MIVEGTVSGRCWRLRPADPARVARIAQHHGLPEILARVLAARGLDSSDVPGFLEPRLRDTLPDPSHLADLDRVAARLADAVEERERIGIVGDYDVDGATSTALVALWLNGFGIVPEIAIPDRLVEGYGASAAILERLARAGCRLVLTLDNGTNAFAALAAAAARGQEVLVIDHHPAQAELPPAYGIVNPNRPDQRSPLVHLAAVGVTFVVLAATARELRRRGRDTGPDLLSLLDLVALGTVCDVVPLDGVNRAFVRQGLKVAARNERPGLAALAARAGLEAVRESWHLAYVLGPRLNAGGRLGEPMLATRLLLARESAEAEAFAARLEELNARRQEIERRLLAAAEAIVQPQLDADAPVLVAAGEAWHPGVLGIVASRLVERFERPAFVLSLGEGVARGSGRSVNGLDLGALVSEAKRLGLLREGGGHAMAAGLALDVERLEEFAAFARERAERVLVPDEPAPLDLDGALTVAGVTVELACALDRLAPYGPGNEEPRFCLTDARVVEAREVGRGHLACVVAGAAGGRLRGIAFRARERALSGALMRRGEPMRLAGRVKLERYQGEPRVGFEIEDAAAA